MYAIQQERPRDYSLLTECSFSTESDSASLTRHLRMEKKKNTKREKKKNDEKNVHCTHNSTICSTHHHQYSHPLRYILTYSLTSF